MTDGLLAFSLYHQDLTTTTLFSPDLSAIQVLDNLLSAGNAPRHGTESRRPAFVAPPRQLALLANLAIHPDFTTRSSERENAEVAVRALAHLRSVLATVGPLKANFAAVLQFRRGTGRRATTRHGDSSPDGDADGSDSARSDGNERLDGRLSNAASIWNMAPDFWKVLGCAFHCAAANPHRWTHWRVWLQFLLDVLEADWKERLLQDEEDRERIGLEETGGKSVTYPRLEKSLFMQYLRSSELRDVNRALLSFADGSQADKPVYTAVFPKEIEMRAESKATKRKRTQTLDLRHEQYGDYFDEEDQSAVEEEGSEALNEAQRPRRAARGRSQDQESTATFRMTNAMAETVPLRLRLFSLLSAAAFYLEGKLTFDVADLYERFGDSVGGLPLSMFKLLVASHPTLLRPDVYTSFLRYLVEKLLPLKRLSPAKVDPETDKTNGVSIAMLTKCFLPHPAARVSVQHNAKLALVLEAMLRFIWTTSGIAPSVDLRVAVERGIQARAEKTAAKRRGYGGAELSAEDMEARVVLEQSTRNLILLVNLIGADEDCEGGPE